MGINKNNVINMKKHLIIDSLSMKNDILKNYTFKISGGVWKIKKLGKLNLQTLKR